MNVCEVKLLLEGICEQETANEDSLVSLSLQETVTSRGCSLSNVYVAPRPLGQGNAVALRSGPPRGPCPVPSTQPSAGGRMSEGYVSPRGRPWGEARAPGVA